MRKLILGMFAALMMLSSCGSGEREYLEYRGLSLGMLASTFRDSLLNRGYEIDSSLTDDITYVFNNKEIHCRLDVLHMKDTITDVLESFRASYNDSTSHLWQAMHDEFQKEFGWPNMLHNSDIHREAVYRTGRGGLTLTLLNTYAPTLTVRYSTSE